MLYGGGENIMVKEDMWGKIGSWAFIIGIIIAIIVGLIVAFGYLNFKDVNGGYVAVFLALLGLIVGLTSAFGMGTITKEEVPNFLIAGVALIAIAASTFAFGGIKWIGPLFTGLGKSIAIFIAPAMGILAIKAIWDIGKER